MGQRAAQHAHARFSWDRTAAAVSDRILTLARDSVPPRRFINVSSPVILEAAPHFHAVRSAPDELELFAAMSLFAQQRPHASAVDWHHFMQGLGAWRRVLSVWRGLRQLGRWDWFENSLAIAEFASELSAALPCRDDAQCTHQCFSVRVFLSTCLSSFCLSCSVCCS